MTLDDAIDELFGVDRDAFVARRAQLVRELKERGAKEEAELLAKVRKPTVFAWTLNRLVRTERHDVDLLLDAGYLLREAQAGVLRGHDPVEFDHARQLERDVVARLERAAAKLLGGSSSTLLPKLSATLRAAAVTEEGRELLARGRFVEPLEPVGFDALAGLAPAGPPHRKSAGDARREANEALREAKARAAELARAAGRAEERAERLELELADARREAERAREAAEEARRSLGS